MSAAVDHAFLNARISLYASHLHPAEALSFFLDTDAPVTPDYYRDVGLSQFVASPPETPAQIEQQMVSVLAVEALGLMHAMPVSARRLVREWMRRYEMINLKSLIRCKLTQCSIERTREYLFETEPIGRLPMQQLLLADDIVELLRILSGHDSFLTERIRTHLGDTQELFLIEAAIDSSYYAGLLRSCESLPPADRGEVRQFLGRLVDQVNLVWLLRYRIAYDVQPPHAFFMMIRTGHFLGRDILARLAGLADFEAIKEALPAEYRDSLKEAASVFDVERQIRDRTMAFARKQLNYGFFSLGRGIAYLYLRERQLLEMHQLLKGRMLGFSADQIRTSLGWSDE